MKTSWLFSLRYLALSMLCLLSGLAQAEEFSDEALKQYPVVYKKQATTPTHIDPYSYSHPKRVNSSAVYGLDDAQATAKLTGYAELNYLRTEHQHSSYTVASLSPIMHIPFNDYLLFKSQLDLSLDNDGLNHTAIEYAQAELLLNDSAKVVGGKFFSPVGKFQNSYYLPWLNKLPSKPAGFDYDGAVLSSSIGLQMRGEVALMNQARANYAVFIANSPRGIVEDEAVAEIDGDGIPNDFGRNKIWGGRIGFSPMPALEIGGSIAMGKIGLFSEVGDMLESARDYNLLGADINYTLGNLEVRAEYSQQQISAKAASDLPQSVKWKAWYVQGAYRFLPSNWEAVLRSGYFSSPIDEDTQRQVAVGINYWFTDTIVTKLAYEINRGEVDSSANNNRLLAQFVYHF